MAASAPTTSAANSTPDTDRYNYFNVYAFGRPLDGSLGNTGKTVIRLPGINKWDLSLFKNFRMTERMNLQFRFETFNTLNHTQWAGVNTGLSLPNPGMAMRGQQGKLRRGVGHA